MKTEISENIPTSSAPVTLGSLFKKMNSQMRSQQQQMQQIETLSNEKIESLETCLQNSQAEKDELQKEVQKLKSLLAEKERDYKLYYSQYQNIAKENEDLKLKINRTMTAGTIENQNLEHSEPINDTLSESLLFTTPESMNTSAVDTASGTVELVAVSDETSMERPRAIAKARKRSRAPTSDCGAPAEKISKKLYTPTHFKCSNCLKENGEATFFDEINDYRNHVIQSHPKRFLCDQCPQNCISNIDLQRHKQKVHSLSVKSVGFDCSLCNTSYPRLNLLNQHIKLYH